MFENPRRGRQARNFTTNVPKILDLKSSSEQIFSENCRWVPLLFPFYFYRYIERYRHAVHELLIRFVRVIFEITRVQNQNQLFVTRSVNRLC